MMTCPICHDSLEKRVWIQHEAPYSQVHRVHKKCMQHWVRATGRCDCFYQCGQRFDRDRIFSEDKMRKFAVNAVLGAGISVAATLTTGAVIAGRRLWFPISLSPFGFATGVKVCAMSVFSALGVILCAIPASIEIEMKLKDLAVVIDDRDSLALRAANVFGTTVLATIAALDSILPFPFPSTFLELGKIAASIPLITGIATGIMAVTGKTFSRIFH